MDKKKKRERGIHLQKKVCIRTYTIMCAQKHKSQSTFVLRGVENRGERKSESSVRL